jgi:threonine aldolase
MTNRRSFLKAAGLAGLPLLLSNKVLAGTPPTHQEIGLPGINFVADCDLFSPREYAEKLLAICTNRQDTEDRYHEGGAVQDLERAMAELTGKEAAIFMPSGTMANQLAMKALSGDKPKIYVQETSHVYRDEADAAQAVHNRRLIALAAGKPYFTLQELKEAHHHHSTGEYMSAAVGAVSIEVPVRRGGNQNVPLKDLKEISDWCRTEGWPLHLDGARLHIASAWTGVPVKDYAALFDTVYISLYKYLGAAGGAVLCGPASIITPLHRQVKIHGGNMLHAWPYAAMALQNLEGIEGRLQEVKKRADELVALFNKSQKIGFKQKPGATNVYNLGIPLGTDVQKFKKILFDEENMVLGSVDDRGYIACTLNESILKRPAAEIAEVMLKAVKVAKEGKKQKDG